MRAEGSSVYNDPSVVHSSSPRPGLHHLLPHPRHLPVLRLQKYHLALFIMSAYAIPTMSLSYEDHRRLFTVLPPSLHKIISATPARIYQAALQSSDKDWQYTGMKGILVFGCDNRSRLSPSNPGFYDGGSFWFKLVDCRKGKLLWQHQLQDILEYEADKPFFHAFTVKVRPHLRVALCGVARD